MNRRILESSAHEQLRPYCFVIDTFVRADPPLRGEALKPHRFFPVGMGSGARDWRGDVVMIGECSGGADLGLVSRAIEGIVRAGRTLLYLSTSSGESRHLRSRFAGSSAVTILDVRATGLERAARSHLERDLALLQPLLRSGGAWLGKESLPALKEVARMKAFWQRLRPRLDCRALVVRTNYRPLSAVAVTADAATELLTVSFQHSIVTAPASFVPIPSKRYVAFGPTSAALVEKLDRQIADESGRPRVCRSIIAAGSLNDPIVPRSPSMTSGRILVIDSGEGFAPRFYGAGDQYAALERAVFALAKVGGKVMVRPHPRGGAGRWRRLLAGTAIELSSGRSLADDLGAASVVVGLFSTVLPVAAATGIPTLFLWQPGWFFTPDLEPFVAGHFVTPDEASGRVATLRREPDAFGAACGSARAAGSRYFEGGRRCEFDAPFVESMLAPLPSTARTN